MQMQSKSINIKMIYKLYLSFMKIIKFIKIDILQIKMRTLAKPQKTKQIEKSKGNNQKGNQKQIFKKPQSKKITKTVFQDPFHYRIQSLSHEDMDQLMIDFSPYLKELRKKMPVKQSAGHTKFISFIESQNKRQTLTNQQLILGVKSVAKTLKKQPLQLILVFYEENRYEILQALLFQAIAIKVPIIICRTIQALQQQLAVKSLTCIGLKNAQISHKLSKLCSKCSVQIPWLVNKDWIQLKEN